MKKFTLIELLVVVAIIGILVSLLMPSLLKARQEAKKAVCLSNLRQIGVTVNLYQKNNNWYYPPQMKNSSYVNWFGKVGLGVNSKKVPGKRPLNHYLLNTTNIPDDAEVEVAECPGDEKGYRIWGTSYKPNLRHTIKGLYIFNSKSSRSIHEINSPSKFVVISETGAFRNVANLLLWDFLYAHSKIGEPKWTQLFADGHVKFNTVYAGVVTTEEYTYHRNK